MNKLRLILYKLGLLKSKPLNQPYRIIDEFRYSYDWGRCLFVNEQQYYSDKNVYKTHNGYEFVVKKEHVVDNAWWNPNKIEFDYTSGMLFSKEKFLYGSFEAEIFIPKGYGLWSAFWLYGGGEPKKHAEIDIFEYYGSEHKFTHNTHLDYNRGKDVYGNSDGIVLKGLENSWHKYRLDWTIDKLKYYIDDKLVGIRTAKEINIPLTLIVNMAVEKNIGDRLDKDLPTIMQIKNIKYYGLHE